MIINKVRKCGRKFLENIFTTQKSSANNMVICYGQYCKLLSNLCKIVHRFFNGMKLLKC